MLFGFLYLFAAITIGALAGYGFAMTRKPVVRTQQDLVTIIAYLVLSFIFALSAVAAFSGA